MIDNFAANVWQILERAERDLCLDKAISTDFGKSLNEMAEQFRVTSERVDGDLKRGARITKHRTRL